MRKGLIVIFSIFACASSTMASAFTAVSVPGAANTYAYGSSGNTIVGYFTDAAGYHGFADNNGSFATFDAPNGVNYTWAYGISGPDIIGQYYTGSGNGYSYTYDGTNWSNLSTGANVYGADGNNFVGWDINMYGFYGFIFNPSGNYSSLKVPGSSDTHACGIHADKIVGYYDNASGGNHAFLNSGGSWDNGSGTWVGGKWTSLDFPFNPPYPTIATQAYGVFNDWVVGSYTTTSGTHGYIYSISAGTYTALNVDFPGAHNTIAYGIDNYTVVGTFQDSLGVEHGFTYAIPEPATLSLIIFGGTFLLRRKK